MNRDVELGEGLGGADPRTDARPQRRGSGRGADPAPSGQWAIEFEQITRVRAIVPGATKRAAIAHAKRYLRARTIVSAERVPDVPLIEDPQARVPAPRPESNGPRPLSPHARALQQALGTIFGFRRERA